MKPDKYLCHLSLVFSQALMGRGLFNLVQVGNLKEIHCNFYDNPTANFTLESNALLNQISLMVKCLPKKCPDLWSLRLTIWQSVTMIFTFACVSELDTDATLHRTLIIMHILLILKRLTES